jgi:RES domain-containing protein
LVDTRTVARIDALAPVPLTAEAHRHLETKRNPLAGTGARIHGGRWNPPESFPVLYLGLTPAVVEAEFERMAHLAGTRVEDFLPRAFVRYRVTLNKVLDLRNPGARDSIGLTDGELYGDDRTPCQRVGDAAHYLGLEGVLAPSATRAGDALAVFTDRLGASSTIEVLDQTVWTAPPRSQ